MEKLVPRVSHWNPVVSFRSKCLISVGCCGRRERAQLMSRPEGRRTRSCSTEEETGNSTNYIGWSLILKYKWLVILYVVSQVAHERRESEEKKPTYGNFWEIIGRARLENRAQACIASLKPFMCSSLFPGRILGYQHYIGWSWCTHTKQRESLLCAEIILNQLYTVITNNYNDIMWGTFSVVSCFMLHYFRDICG